MKRHAIPAAVAAFAAAVVMAAFSLQSAMAGTEVRRKVQKTDEQGHVLVRDWKTYSRMEESDRPESASDVLVRIIEKAKSENLPWDFCDAWARYLDIMTSRNWKLADSLESRMFSDAAGYGSPVSLLYLRYIYGTDAGPDSLLAFVRRHEADLAAGRNAGFYSSLYRFYIPDRCIRRIPGFIVENISDDYGFALWFLYLQSRGSDDCRLTADATFRLLSESLAGRYPEAAYLEFLSIGKDKDGNLSEDGLRTFISRYEGKAIALYAEEELLAQEYRHLQHISSLKASERGMTLRELSSEYLSLKDSLSAFRKARESFSGKEKSVAMECVSASMFEADLDRKSIALTAASAGGSDNVGNGGGNAGSSGDNACSGCVKVELANLTGCTLSVLRKSDEKYDPVYEVAISSDNSYYHVADTVEAVLPPLDDGHYLISCRAGDVSEESPLDIVSVSAACRFDGSTCGVYAADADSGRPLENATIKIYCRDSLIFYRDSVSFAGFEPLGMEILSQYRDSLKYMSLECSYTDSLGCTRVSPRVSLRNSWSPVPEGSPEDRPYLSCCILKDRAAFVPGDTLRFKAIMYETSSKGMDVLGEGTEAVVSVYGPDGKTIGEQTFRTNAYGSFSGAFPLPSGHRNGTFSMKVRALGKDVPSSGGAFTVDSFVLPTFSLKFDPMDIIVLPGDTVHVSGTLRSFTGFSLSSADISYTVADGLDVVASGLVHADGNGRFSFPFKAGSRDDSYSYYDVTVTVSDLSGESLEFSTWLSISYNMSLSAVFGSAADGLLRTRWSSGGHSRYSRSDESILEGDTAVYDFVLTNSEGTEVGGRPVSYSLVHDGKTVSDGMASSGERISLDLYGAPSGKYVFRAECPVEFRAADGRDTSIVLRYTHSFLRVDEDEASLEAPGVEFFAKPGKGEDPVVTIGSSEGPLWVVAELWDEDMELLASDLVFLSGKDGERGSQKTLRYGRDLCPSGRAVLRLFYFKDNSSVSFSHVYEQACTKPQMPLEFVSFTDETVPGGECVFEARTLPGAEVLISAFDISTESIRSNAWNGPAASGRKPVGIVPVSHEEGCGFRLGYDGGLSYMDELMGNAMPGLMLKSSSRADIPAVAEDAAAGMSVDTDAVRSDFANTLAFMPFLVAGEDSTVRFSFHASDKISTYVVSVFAHDKSMDNASVRRNMLVTRKIMVSAAVPQFLYESDRYVLKATLGNSSYAPVSGMMTLYVYGSGDFRSSVPLLVRSVPVSANAGKTVAEEFEVSVPETADTLGFLVSFKGTAGKGDSLLAEGSSVSDGVFHAVPVYPAVQEIVETHSGVYSDESQKDSLYAALSGMFVNGSGYGAESESISLAGLLDEALPEKSVPEDGDAISLAEALFSSVLCGRDSLAEAYSGRLKEYLNPDGGLAWFPGMKSSPEVTVVVMELLAGIRDRSLADRSCPETVSRTIVYFASRTIPYLDSCFISGFEESFRSSGGGRSSGNKLSGGIFCFGGICPERYICLRTRYPEIELSLPDDRKLVSAFRKEIKEVLDVKGKDVLRGQILAKAYRISVAMDLCSAQSEGLASAFGLGRSSLRKLVGNAMRDIRSLTEYAVEHRSGGVYYPNAVMPLRGQLESELYAHSLICDVLSRYAAVPAWNLADPRLGKVWEDEALGKEAAGIADGIRVWLMIQRETQAWNGDPASVMALSSVKDGIDAIGNISVLVLRKRFEKPFEEVVPSGNGFTISRSYYVERIVQQEDGSDRLERIALNEGDTLSVGDKVISVCSIWSAENRSYVRISVPFPASLRPVDQLSSVVYGFARPVMMPYGMVLPVYPQGYREVRTGEIVHYYDIYPEENTSIEEEYIVTQEGTFSEPAAEIECLYAPHYRANTGAEEKMKIN